MLSLLADLLDKQMDLVVISIAAVAVYAIATILQGVAMSRSQLHCKWWVLLLGLVAVCLHGILLHEWIDIHSGQNLNFFNMFSLVCWLVTVLVLVMILIRPVEVLMLVLYPFDIISIILVWLFPSFVIINTAQQPITLFHILLSVFTFCVLCVAALLAILLALQEVLLRNKKMPSLMQRLPALDAMETLMFQVIGLGFVLLSVVIVTSLYFYHAMLWHHPLLIQKTILVIMAWVIFAVLLVGRYQRGWRGRKAIYATIVGVLLLCVAYFGSKLLLQALH